MKKPVNVVKALSAVAAIVGLVGGSGLAVADPNWPSKPITIIVPFPAGGGTSGGGGGGTSSLGASMVKFFSLTFGFLTCSLGKFLMMNVTKNAAPAKATKPAKMRVMRLL